MAERTLDGYTFVSDEDVELARSELDKIRYVSGKLNANNPEIVLQVYNKLASGKIMATPVGYEYLRELQKYLYSCPQIDDARVLPVPVVVDISKSLHSSAEKEPERRSYTTEKAPTKNFRKQYKTSLIFNVILVLIVMAFYVVALKSDYPNIINYRNQITNEYASWEQELTEREAVVREKEAELKGQ